VASSGTNPAQQVHVAKQLAAVTERIQAAEARVREIDDVFCQPEYYARTPAGDVRAREAERKALQATLAELLAEWERLEQEVAALG
jgi:hypothetical protein